jgi:hypothetical protein
MLDAEPERLQLLPTDSSRVRTVDISVEQEWRRSVTRLKKGRIKDARDGIDRAGIGGHVAQDFPQVLGKRIEDIGRTSSEQTRLDASRWRALGWRWESSACPYLGPPSGACVIREYRVWVAYVNVSLQENSIHDDVEHAWASRVHA